jgi:peptide deformylase
MAVLPIRQFPETVLKRVAEPVAAFNGKIRKLLDDMAETMYDAPGIGLAAPQVGVSLRVIVVDVDWREKDREPRGYLNPEIILSEGSISLEEGCLSVPEYQAEVTRAARVVMKALDPDGNPVEVVAKGMQAVCLQHEIDHLNGTLYIDRISRLRRSLYVKRRKKALAEKG